MSEQYKSLCWKCKKACNSNLCIWVKHCTLINGHRTLTREETLKLMPKGVELDSKKNVLFCPHFEPDNMVYSMEEEAKTYNLSFLKNRTRRIKIRQVISKLFNIKNKDFDCYFDFEILNYYFNKVFKKHDELFKSIVNDKFKSVANMSQKYNMKECEIKNIFSIFKSELKQVILNDWDNGKFENQDVLIANWLKDNNFKIKDNLTNAIFKENKRK